MFSNCVVFISAVKSVGSWTPKLASVVTKLWEIRYVVMATTETMPLGSAAVVKSGIVASIK